MYKRQRENSIDFTDLLESVPTTNLETPNVTTLQQVLSDQLVCPQCRRSNLVPVLLNLKGESAFVCMGATNSVTSSEIKPVKLTEVSPHTRSTTQTLLQTNSSRLIKRNENCLKVDTASAALSADPQHLAAYTPTSHTTNDHIFDGSIPELGEPTRYQSTNTNLL